LFGDGGGAGGAGGGDGGAAAGGAEGTGAPAQAQDASLNNARGKQDLSRVVYGKQQADTSADSDQEPQEADDGPRKTNTDTPSKKPTFDELMQDPEYKAEFQRRFDKQFNRRFAESKGQQEQMKKLAPALNLLAGKYGTAAGDVDALLEAINADNDLIERQAYDKGMEPDAYREYNRVMAENQQLKQAEQERQRQTQVNAQYQKWVQQAEAARQTYPGLNLQNEVRNPQFAQLLGAGIDVATAYQVVHMGELSSQLVQKTAEEVKQSTVNAIKANQGRPRENGAQAPKAATVKSDVTKLKARDFDEIIRRASRGDKISW
jgi:hypothetical protein